MTSSHGKITLKIGQTIAYKQWGIHNTKKVLAVHGWLDNANSFNYLGPYLADRGYRVVAPDLIGHGRSSHLSPDGSYNAFGYLLSLRLFSDELGWSKSTIIGHSMGGGVNSAYAAVFPERVDALVMIDALGPRPRPARQTVSIARQRIDYELKLLNKPPVRKVYATMEDAMNTRIRNVASYPGSQTISREAAKAIVSRGVTLLNGSTNDDDITDLNAGPVSYCHDLSLMKPMYYYITDDQAVAIMNSISCPSLVISAERGWPLGDAHEIEQRKKPLLDKGILTHIEIPGSSHHLHLDPDHAPLVAKNIEEFLNKTLIEGITSFDNDEIAREPL